MNHSDPPKHATMRRKFLSHRGAASSSLDGPRWWLRLLLTVAAPVALLVAEHVFNVLDLSKTESILSSTVLFLIGWLFVFQIDTIRKDEQLTRLIQDERASLQQKTEAVLREQQSLVETLFHASMTNLDVMRLSTEQLRALGPSSIEFHFAGSIMEEARKGMKRLLDDRMFSIELRSPADQYANRWIEQLDTLMRDEATFNTVTNVVVWGRGCLGFRGGTSTYLDKQIEAVRQHELTVRRLFVVPAKQMLQRDRALAFTVQDVLQKYRRFTDAITEPARARMQCRVLEMDRDEYDEHFARAPVEIAQFASSVSNGEIWSGNFGVWQAKGRSVVNLVRYDEDIPSGARTVAAISFVINKPELANACSSFVDSKWRSPVSETLTDYLAALEGILAAPGTPAPVSATVDPTVGEGAERRVVLQPQRATELGGAPAVGHASGQSAE